MIELGKAEKLADLIELTHEAENHFGCQVWFRGQADIAWGLTPSAHRRNQTLEAEFLKHFRLRAPALSADCPQHHDYVSWLPLMQHYGLPTRLLDWTESLLIALFFALNEDKEADAAIWIMSPWNLNQLTGAAIVPFLTSEAVAPYVKDAFNGQTPEARRHSIAVMAPRTDRRMLAQLGNYTIHGTRDTLERNEGSDEFLARVTLPMAAHERLLKDLSVTGTTLSSVFPDLSNLAKEIAGFRALDADGGVLDESLRVHR